jgi:hypothetical protein
MAWYIIEECLRIIIEKDSDNKGEELYTNERLPKDVRNIYQRIIKGEVNP